MANHPLAGVDAAALRPGLRKWTVGPYLILYIVGVGQIEVVRVVHGAHDVYHLDGF